ncbi:unnamed protein product [Penicillium discolor]
MKQFEPWGSGTLSQFAGDEVHEGTLVVVNILHMQLDKWSWFLPSFESKARQRRRGAPRTPRDPLLTKVRSYLPN